MKVLVDALRGTRPESPGPGQPTTSVAQELASRLLRFSSGSAVQVGLWHTTALRGLAKWCAPRERQHPAQTKLQTILSQTRKPHRCSRETTTDHQSRISGFCHHGSTRS